MHIESVLDCAIDCAIDGAIEFSSFTAVEIVSLIS